VVVASLLLIAVAGVLLVLGIVRDGDAYVVASIGVSVVAAVALAIGSRQGARPRATAAGDAERELVPAGARTAAGPEGAAALSVPATALPVPAREPDTVVQPRPRASEEATDPALRIAAGPHEGASDPPTERLAAVGAPFGTAPAGTAPAGSAPAGSAPAGSAPAGSAPAAEDEVTAALPAAHAGVSTSLPGDEPPEEPVSLVQAARLAGMDADVLVVDGRPRYHLSGCRHLVGRDSEPLPVDEAVELGFSPCGLCRPASVLAGSGG